MFKFGTIRTSHNVTLLGETFKWILVDIKDKGFYIFKKPLWCRLFKIKDVTVSFGNKEGFFLEVRPIWGCNYPEPEDFCLQLRSWGTKSDGVKVDLSFGKWKYKKSIKEIDKDKIPESLNNKLIKELI